MYKQHLLLLYTFIIYKYSKIKRLFQIQFFALIVNSLPYSQLTLEHVCINNNLSRKIWSVI